MTDLIYRFKAQGGLIAPAAPIERHALGPYFNSSQISPASVVWPGLISTLQRRGVVERSCLTVLT
jgi:hypothetical protein